ncbi:alpha-L-fucosidase [Mucilaginibacter sp.]|jgi:alpha-L-fucosidase|uniref:alpha-L-fucosidase n=1 Tax=Mucilaginibacter sp. TaxID=1882438 RepID=UPI002CE1F10D|nr:alpha-L-fucosidase [Mucilaginibacter sp.]HTI59212.1 alpha-L-fucosidase [Mucilaginibacter sp.]
MPKKITLFTSILIACSLIANSQQKPLQQLQQQFVDLRFGMFIHFNIPTYMNQDWADPDAKAAIFNPTSVDCDQWAKAAKSANMTYGCLTTKHHSGFCIWDTKTTDYNVMHSPYKKDIVRQFVDAFRKNGLKVMLYYSILDTHHRLRPHKITPAHIKMIKGQLTELLSNYGPIEALIIDGWDAPWSRISYDDVPFEEIYHLVKKLQPNCVIMDLNGAKYPAQGMYYTDIKTYEMGAGQRVSKDGNTMPALACLPLQKSWFWKTSFPNEPTKDPEKLVNDLIKPLNNADVNFILNVAPNRDGRFDDNALASLKKIGELWHNEGPEPTLPKLDAPVISHNIAKNKPSNSSWGDDDNIMDLANDDDFTTSWVSNTTVDKPWWEVDLGKETAFNTISIAQDKPRISDYVLEYYHAGTWKPVFNGTNTKQVKVNRFKTVTGSKVRIRILKSDGQPSIAEFGVYNEVKGQR